MNRTTKEAAKLLGVRHSTLRERLRTIRAINADGSLAAQHVGKGNLFIDVRSRWNPHLGKYSHYGVLMVTEAGIDWLAKQLGVAITQVTSKESAA